MLTNEQIVTALTISGMAATSRGTIINYRSFARAIEREARRQERERAIAACDSVSERFNKVNADADMGACECAEAIRALDDE